MTPQRDPDPITSRGSLHEAPSNSCLYSGGEAFVIAHLFLFYRWHTAGRELN